MDRKVLGLFLILVLALTVFLVYDNLQWINSTISPEITLIIAFLLPIPLIILEFFFMEVGQIIMGKSTREETEFGVAVAYTLSISATFAIMANLFIALPELLFAQVSGPLLIFLLVLLPILLVLWFNASTPRAMDEHGVIDEKKLKPDSRPFNILAPIVLLAACLIIWTSSTEFITFVFGTVLVFMGFTLVVPLMFYPVKVFNYFVHDWLGGPMSGVEMFFVYAIYPIAVIAGAIVGSIAFLVASLL